MGHIKNRSGGCWWYFTFALVAIFLAIFLQVMFSSENRAVKISERVQRVLREKENKMQFLLSEFSREFEKKEATEDSFFERKKQVDFDKEGMAVFIFRNDSLVYWSTNEIPGIESLSGLQKSGDTSVVRLKNGWFELMFSRTGRTTLTGLILIKHSFPNKNSYLSENFQADFQVPPGVKIRRTEGQNEVFSASGKPLFRLVFPATIQPALWKIFLLLFLYLCGGFFLLKFLFQFGRQNKSGTFAGSRFFVFLILGLVILRFLQQYFHIPQILYSHALFGPGYFSCSKILPSLGDLFLNCLLGLLVAYLFYKDYPEQFSPKKNIKSKLVLIGTIQVAAVGVLFAGSIFLLRALLVDSSFSLNLQNVAGLTYPSIIGLIITSTVCISFFLFSYRLGLSSWNILRQIRNKEKIHPCISLAGFVSYLLFFSLTATFILNYYNHEIEKGKREILASKLGEKRDPVAELMFAHQEEVILRDTIFHMFHNGGRGAPSSLQEDSLARVIQRKYFREGWNNYSVQVTICIGEKMLKIQPQNYLYDCGAYFRNLIRDFGVKTGSGQLYFLDYGYGFKNYLAVIPIENKSGPGETAAAYIEISSSLLQKNQGYTGLLMNNPNGNAAEIAEYSYAFYRDGKLVQRVGSFEYLLEIKYPYPLIMNKNRFYSKDRYNHFFSPINTHDLLIISRKEPSLTDKIAPFSYLFFFFTLFSILFYSIVNFRGLIRKFFTKMSDRIQVAMTGIMIVSFLILGALIIVYISRLYTKKNIESLSEKTHSIQVELEHKYGGITFPAELKAEEINEQMTKFSNVFFADINLYNPQGELVATSRPEIFEKNLLSRMMCPEAYRQMKDEHASFCVHDEQIGEYHFSSAYMPVYNDRDQLIAYLNLPYFTRQEEIRREVSSFLVAFINVYVFLVILGIIISLVVSSYVSLPLKKLTTGIRGITFGSNNEKISWKHRDEIGTLITEYNRMVDEIARSAELLVRSEREGAWREMAKQVAHEIKNPLTPMKLNVQHLEKAWNDKAPDIEQRLKRFSRTMTEQIEALSTIAEEFSNFAKMPAPKKEPVNLDEVLQSVISFYEEIPSVTYIPSAGSFVPLIVADRKQLIRVFSNLINNALQAVKSDVQGKITVSLETEKESVFVKVMDNGTGIAPELYDKVFVPNFTTKSGGMGLGLAIVKNIVNDCGGEINFESREGKGTSFFIRFPRKKET
jgi:two-component system, NtrC family, nitrogen regulation sensor histidine kinase NtrY